MAACMDIDERFGDLLDVVEDDDCEEDPYMTLLNRRIVDRSSHSENYSHGPLGWSVKGSVELQNVVNSFNVSEFVNLKFSVTVADPRQADFPLVACSSGFSDLTGYNLQEIVGRNCRFLLNGVPQSYINEQTRFRSRDFCTAVSQGTEYDSCNEVLPQGVGPCGHGLPKGELICVQINATKTGELFRNMFYMKQVWLDDKPFILGLQAGILEEYEDETEVQELQRKCKLAWKRLGEHMSTMEEVLSSLFWYGASMRRQD
jgi:hypothetical protein